MFKLFFIVYTRIVGLKFCQNSKYCLNCSINSQFM